MEGTLMTTANHTTSRNTGDRAGTRDSAKASVLEIVAADLAGETDSVLDVLSRLGPPDRDAATPAAGWTTIRDQVTVVTQRCNLPNTGLWVFGPVASEWIALAQAFAGGPGTGRPPGPFENRPTGDLL
jgi:hypothetical protein